MKVVSTKKMPRFFIGPIEICGHYGALTRGLREIGAVAHFLNTPGEGDIYRYATDQGGHWIISLYLRALSIFRLTRGRRRLDPVRYLATAYCLAAQALLVLWAGFCHDVIILKSGLGILNSGYDLKLYKALGRTVIFMYHGSESRPPYINGGYAKFDAAWLADRARWVKDNLRRTAPYATYIVENPLACHFHERPVCIYQIIGSAVDRSKVNGVERSVRSQDGSVKILHAPSLVEIKGTDVVRRTIELLKRKGLPIVYEELTNVPNALVMKKIGESDIVVDELYSDTFAAMLSLEAIMLGRPSVVGGYGFDILDQVVPPEYAVPTVRTTPETLATELERLVLDEALRRRIAEQSQQFADHHVTPRSMAERVLRLATGQAPAEWFFDPRDATHLLGVGASRPVIEGMVRRLIENEGLEALQLQDKPHLAERFAALAQNSAALPRTVEVVS